MSFLSGKLIVDVKCAFLTKDLCVHGKMDPYCIVKLNSSKSFKTKVKTDEGLIPVWDETFIFDVAGENTLQVEVYHNIHIIGKVMIDLKYITLDNMIEKLFPLFNNSEPVGKIKIKLFFQSPKGSFLKEQLNNSEKTLKNNFIEKENVNNMNISNQKVSYHKQNSHNNNFISNKINLNSNQRDSNENYYNVINNNEFDKSNHVEQINHPKQNLNSKFNSNTDISLKNEPKQWEINLHYNNKPYYFTNNKVFLYDFNHKMWKQIECKENLRFPKYHRSTLLPDGSFIITGGEFFNGLTQYTGHLINSNLIQLENMNLKRKLHSTTYLKGIKLILKKGLYMFLEDSVIKVKRL